MARRDALGLIAVTTEGALLPPGLLHRIHTDDPKLEGLKPADYGLEGERVRDAAARAWNALQSRWELFNARRAGGALTPAVTRDAWVNHLARELGYGQLQQHAVSAIEVEGRAYPVRYLLGHVPLHLVSCNQSLDSAANEGDRREKPHSLVQLLLNASDDHLWGFATNGLQWRILRDSRSLSRQAMVEFDLELIFSQGLYDEFLLFYLVCHQSRVQSARPEGCRLELWHLSAAEEGKRALDTLRNGVQDAIVALGQGFLKQADNRALLAAIRGGTLDKQDYYRQLLRLVYRLLFLFVAEDRDLLLVGDRTDPGRALYLEGYSTRRLRLLAERMAGSHRHHDLFEQLKLIFTKLDRDGCPELALPALGGFLFSAEAIDDLGQARIANADLLEAVRCLAVTSEGGRRARVDYKNLGSEELGSVYESLLELHPELDTMAGAFSLKAAGGNERKSTGSYYTPDSLIQCLLDSALDPVMDAAVAGSGPKVVSGEWAGSGSGEWAVGSGGTAARDDASASPHSPRAMPRPPLPTHHSLLTTPQPEVHDDRDVLPRSSGLAVGHGPGGSRVRLDTAVSEGGDVRDVEPGATGGRVGTGEHRRGLREGQPGGVRAVPEDCPGQPEGTGNTPPALGAGRPGSLADGTAIAGSGRRTWQDAAHADTPAPGQTIGSNAAVGSAEGSSEWAVGSGGTASGSTRPSTPHSPLPTAQDPSATAHSPLTTHPASPPTTPEQRLLALRIIDPAVGSGHFLIAAAHRMARRLAVVRTGDEEPSPSATRAALRDVIDNCLYGVDLNPMAAELCKVALWMESLEPGKPLGFLDSHVVVGNSLMGATPELIAAGVPDSAYPVIWDDFGPTCSALKKQNKQERDGQGALFAPAAFSGPDLARAYRQVEAMPQDDLDSVRAKERAYADLKGASDMRRRVADAWCAAFTLQKTEPTRETCVTTATVRALANSAPVAQETLDRIAADADRFAFFHPHLAFPAVFADGGFDVVLGNPPWERVKLQEKEFFAERHPAVAAAPNAAARKRMIDDLHGTPLYAEFEAAGRMAEAISSFIRRSGRFPLAGRGDVNTYPVFVELGRSLLAPAGRLGVVVPTGIATDDTTKDLFQDMVVRRSLHSYYGFKNERFLFARPVEHTVTFGLLTVVGSGQVCTRMEFTWLCWTVEEMKDPGRRVVITPEDIQLLNPNTGTCPIFRTQRDAEITKAIYRRVPVLIREGDPDGNPWGITFQRMFDMSNDSALFRTREELEQAGGQLVGNRWTVPSWTRVRGKEIEEGLWLPLYEAKMVHQYDHRWATYETVTVARGKRQVGEPEARDVTCDEKCNTSFVAQPRYWVHAEEVARTAKSADGWFIGFRDICRSTDVRTAIASALPRSAVGHTAPLVHSPVPPISQNLLLSCLLSHVLDYVARQKIGGTHLTYMYLEQLPVAPPGTYAQDCAWAPVSILTWIASRSLELSYTATDMEAFARDLGYEGDPFVWNDERRFALRCELDAAFFHLYGIERDDVDYIMETFPIVKQNDMAAHGSYRTKATILEIYDEMARAMAGGPAYQTRLNPPPANGWVPVVGSSELAVGSGGTAAGDDASATAYSPLTTHEAPPATAHSPLTTHDASPATAHCPLTTHEAPPPATPHSPLTTHEASPLVLAAPPEAPAAEPQRMRVRDQEGNVVLNRGTLVSRERKGDTVVYTIIPEGETTPVKYESPPAVVMRLVPKTGSGKW